MRRVLALMICAAAALPGSALARDAARLSDVQGSVLVGTPEGFRAVSGSTALRAGDQVVVGAGSSVVLSYGGDCRVKLAPGSEVTITEQSCVVGTQNGPFSLLDPVRPLGWGILMGIITFIATVV